MRKQPQIPASSLRFLNTQYKTNWSGRFKRATKYRRGGYYYNIEPGDSFIAGGFWGLVPSDLKRIICQEGGLTSG